jgi:hypothetical protein
MGYIVKEIPRKTWLQQMKLQHMANYNESKDKFGILLVSNFFFLLSSNLVVKNFILKLNK